ncbi:MAG: biopolymer transporter ExbD [Candidatus Omnitrophica bacterium]|nr:biopolymer transporter ExbD [Candidatus Omnitrophota bacterium]
MIRLQPSHSRQIRPSIQIAPLIDIIFITLIFYMALTVFYQLENEISISVPKAEEAREVDRSPGEIVINIDRKGRVIVNQRELNKTELRLMLKRISALYPNQPVIIRADKRTYHEHVVSVLDTCASTNIWNIAFATLKEDKAT